MTRTVLIAEVVAAALGSEQVARLTGPQWAERVQCWECDHWIETSEDAAVLLLRVVVDEAGTGPAIVVHAHSGCRTSAVESLTVAQIQAHRARHRADNLDVAESASNIQVVATVFDISPTSGYPAVLISHELDVMTVTGGGDRVDVLVSSMVGDGWHPITTLSSPPAAAPPGFRVRFTQEHDAVGAPGLLEVIQPDGQVDTEAEVSPGRSWRTAARDTGHTVLIHGSRYLADWQTRGRAGVKAAVRAGLLVGGIVPVELRGPGNDRAPSVAPRT